MSANYGPLVAKSKTICAVCMRIIVLNRSHSCYWCAFSDGEVAHLSEWLKRGGHSLPKPSESGSRNCSLNSKYNYRTRVLCATRHPFYDYPCASFIIHVQVIATLWCTTSSQDQPSPLTNAILCRWCVTSRYTRLFIREGFDVPSSLATLNAADLDAMGECACMRACHGCRPWLCYLHLLVKMRNNKKIFK